MSFFHLLAILSMFFLSTAGTFETPAVQASIEAWPQIASTLVRAMVTIPALAQVAVLIIIGPFIGKQLSYRFSGVLGMALIAAGGLLPIFVAPNWPFVLVCRAILGAGTGLFGGRNAVLIKSVSEEKAGKWIGLGGVASCLANVLGAAVSGVLVERAWNAGFWVNAPAAFFAILILCVLQDPVEDEMPQKKKTKAEGNSLHPAAYVYAIYMFLASVTLYPIMTGMSTYLSELSLGTSSVAGKIVALYAVGGLMANLTLPRQQAYLGRRHLPFCTGLVAAGQALIALFPNIATITVGTVLCGFGYFAILSLLQVYNGMLQPKERLDYSSILQMLGCQIAAFLSSYYITICGKVIGLRGSEMGSTYLGCAAMFVFLTIWAWFGKVVPYAIRQRGK